MPRKKKAPEEVAPAAPSPEAAPEAPAAPLSKHQQRRAGLLIKRDRRANR